MVARSVGGWRAKTTWEMLDAALDGNVREALLQVDRLLASAEQPIGLLGQISASLRRFAAATRLVLQAEAAGRRIALRDALEQAGIKLVRAKEGGTAAQAPRPATGGPTLPLAACRPTLI